MDMMNKWFKKKRSPITTGWIIVILTLVSSIVLPQLFINWSSCLEIPLKYGPLGDAIGGMTAPIIGMGSAILIFYSFRAQITANEQIQKDSLKNSLESILWNQYDEMKHIFGQINQMILETEQKLEKEKLYLINDPDPISQVMKNVIVPYDIYIKSLFETTAFRNTLAYYFRSGISLMSLIALQRVQGHISREFMLFFTKQVKTFALLNGTKLMNFMSEEFNNDEVNHDVRTLEFEYKEFAKLLLK